MKALGNLAVARILVALSILLVFLAAPPAAFSQPSGWPAEWVLIGTDPPGGAAPENGCPDHRDVTEFYYAADADYLYLRMETVTDAGWPGTDPQGEARYKWFFDVDKGGAVIAGTNAFHVEYLLMVEDRTNTSNVDGQRDRLGEVTLMESNFNPVTTPNGSFTEVWNLGNNGRYILNNPPTGYDWYRALGSGTAGTGGPQGVMGAVIGYRITGDFVDMYVSWAALGNPDGICLLWATDIIVPNLDQTPNCDRVQSNFSACAFQVQRTAKITIVKQTIPGGSPGSFDFTATPGPPLSNFSLADGGSRVFSNLDPGEYTITESSLPGGFTLADIICTGPGTSVDTVNRQLTIDLQPDGNVTCTFVNQGEIGAGNAILTIIKEAVPKSPQLFSFTGGLGAFSLDDDGDGINKSKSSVILAGTPYTVTETVPPGWDLTGIQCEGGTAVIGGDNVTISVSEGGSASCTFTNRQQGRIEVIKNAVPNAGTFSFTGNLGPFVFIGSGSTLFSNLLPGLYEVTEANPSPYTLTSIVIDDPSGDSTVNLADRKASILLDPGELVKVTFNNANEPLLGSISIQKSTQPLTEDLFTFTTNVPNCICGGFFSLTGDPNGLTSSIFQDLPPASYNFKELVPTGWNLSEITCSGGSFSVNGSTLTVNLAAGEHVSCTFRNVSSGVGVPAFSTVGIIAFALLLCALALRFVARKRL